MLTDNQSRLWNEYQQHEDRSPRAEKLHALDAFLQSLVESPRDIWFPWARTLAGRVVDHNEQTAIRVPLFRQVIFPALLEGHQAGIPDCTRWLAGLSRLLNHCPDCRQQLDPKERTEAGLLRTAIARNPADGSSRRRLIETMASGLRYSLHEIPAGVLYGTDGASPEQCQILQKKLEEFRELVAQNDAGHDYRQLIDDCNLHFEAYRNYLLNRAAYNSYQDYLTCRSKSEA